MISAKLLILAVALAVLANARVALTPGWVVPAPVVFLVVALAVTAVMVLAIVAKVRFDRYPAPGSAAAVTS